VQSELLGIALTSLALAVIIFVKNRLPFQTFDATEIWGSLAGRGTFPPLALGL